MSVHVKAQCRAGCGGLGDPELEYLCVDCHGDRVEQQQQQALLEYMAKEAATTAVQEEPARKLSIVEAAPQPKRRGPRPVDHAKALEEFLSEPREQDPDVVVREMLFLKREMEVRETSKKQLRKYMVATDEEEPADAKEWSRYQYGAPHPVPLRDVDEAAESAAQTMLFCYWRRRRVQQRIESKRQLLEAERQAALKAKKSGKSRRGLSLGSFRHSFKTAVDQTATSSADNNTKATDKKRTPALFHAWGKKPSNKKL